jgi:hypothetical protein
VALLPELGYAPVNKYLPPRPKKQFGEHTASPELAPLTPQPGEGFLGWIDRVLSN